MNYFTRFRVVYIVTLLLLCIRESVAIFFNKTSRIELKPFNFSRGFTLTFKTCNGGTLLQQNGANRDYFHLYVVPGFMNHTSQRFTPSSLALKWKTQSKEDMVHVGEEMDQNKPYEVLFLPGVRNFRNSTLSVGIGASKSTVQVSNTVLDFVSSGNLTLGSGFVGCIDFGSSFNVMDSLNNVSVSENCPLDSKPSCKRKKCPDGFKGYYCEVNVDNCASLPCHHASTCVDQIDNYTCVCGAGWYGRNCNQLKERKLCDYKPCANEGICRHTSDFNNYTCTCKEPYTGRNCTNIVDPCDSNPCDNNGTCRNITSTYFQCDCPQGFGGRRCEVNIDDCAAVDCGRGSCIDGVSNYSCNCTGTGFDGTSCEIDINECDQSPCVHNGTCTNFGGGYLCNCVKGYSGKNCETNIDDCASRPCKNGGNCTDLVNGFSCLCPRGFSGEFCESELHPCNIERKCSACDANPCRNGSCNCTCSLYTMSYSCTCDAGFQGVNCSEDIDECANSSLCYNGTCINQEGGFFCQCQEYYTGKYCNETKSICHPNPCAHGTCFNLTETTYNCSCFDGWKGRNCTEDVDECTDNIDKCNSTTGTCKNTHGNYTCECRSGYTGRFCHDDIDECKPETNPCLNGGGCRNKPGTYECLCRNGYTDKNCSTNIDDCALGGNENCKNGRCVDLIPGFRCECYVGWEGNMCDEDVDECRLGYCKNNISCLNTPGNYSCTCLAGYTDFNCTTDIDECLSDPCQYNGTCKDAVNGYNCSCSTGYEGKSCENDIDWCDAQRYNGSRPCMYGDCFDQVLNYTCKCFDGFHGANCEIDVNECISDPCQNGATCVQKSNDTAIIAHFGPNVTYARNDSGGYLCICKPGFNGSNCEINIDECQLYNPCNSTGTETCNDSINDYNCTCKPGYKGRNCSKDIDECDSNPCFNNGTCLNLEARFMCVCDSNHTGERCQSRIDPCTAYQPCQNRGNCTVTSDFNFTCSCPEGFAGDTCINKTTLGFDGTTSMTISLAEVSFNISFSFQTVLPDGVLVLEPTKWTMALRSGYLEVIWGNSVLFSLGSENSYSDSQWHMVLLSVDQNYISAAVDQGTCSENCSNKTKLPMEKSAALSTETKLFVGGASGAWDRSNFTGSIRDFMVNEQQYYPGVSGVVLNDAVPDFLRRNVCLPDPCINGECKDLWTRYQCECHRNWTSTNCTEVVQWGTFGTISRLNSGYVSKGNQSYAQYSVSKNFQSLDFSMRTRSQSSTVMLLYSNASVHLSIEVTDGPLQLRYNGEILTFEGNGAVNVGDGTEHHVSINRSSVQIDGLSLGVTLPLLTVKEMFVGGVSENFTSNPFRSLAPFRGCIRDVRLNGEQLLFFNQTIDPLISTQQNIAVGCSSEDVCGNLSGSSPCSNNGNCSDLWNRYSCSCPWPYGGDNCELYGCQWTNPCPNNATCVNVKERAEYECVIEATFNGSQSSVFFTNSTPFSNANPLVAQFRTRQNASSILVSVHNGTFFEVVIQEGHLVISYNLEDNITGTVNTDWYVSDGKWHELRVETNTSQTSVVISSMNFLNGRYSYSMKYSLVKNVSILNRAFTNLVSTAGIRLGSPSEKTGEHLIGCLREIRIGGHLLSFLENLTVEKQPGFGPAKSAFKERNLRKITSGCVGSPVCSNSPCGNGTCVDLWNDFSCTCPAYHRGRFCEYNSCSSSPCTNGTCLVEENGFKCDCYSGYVGRLCNQSCNNSNPCQNGGECSTSTGGLACTCEDGWTGPFCEVVLPQESDDDDDNLPLIIGLSVGAGCLLLIIVAIIFACTRQTSSTFGTYSPSGEEKMGPRVEMSPVLNLPPPEKLI